MLQSEGSVVTLGKVDVVQATGLGARFKILKFPTIKIFSDGSDSAEEYSGLFLLFIH